jgi:hypothetical protein
MCPARHQYQVCAQQMCTSQQQHKQIPVSAKASGDQYMCVAVLAPGICNRRTCGDCHIQMHATACRHMHESSAQPKDSRGAQTAFIECASCNRQPCQGHLHSHCSRVPRSMWYCWGSRLKQQQHRQRAKSNCLSAKSSAVAEVVCKICQHPEQLWQAWSRQQLLINTGSATTQTSSSNIRGISDRLTMLLHSNSCKHIA